MLYSTTTQYAIRGLTELCVRAGQGSLMLDQLISGTDLPRPFLAKVFQQLVKAKILASTRGRHGGFALARPAHDISLLQIISAIDGANFCDGCALGLEQCNDAAPCPMHDLYKPIRQRLKDHLQTTTLADLVASSRSKR